MNPLLLAVILTIVPLVELRGGLPVALINAPKYHVSQLLIFAVIVLLNILLIFVVFFFLDYVHKFLLRFKSYDKFYKVYLRAMRKKIDKFERSHETWGFFALFLFVGVPLPMTGAYTGVFLAWLFGLERKRSILAIALGVLLAGILVYLATIGILKVF